MWPWQRVGLESLGKEFWAYLRAVGSHLEGLGSGGDAQVSVGGEEPGGRQVSGQSRAGGLGQRQKQWRQGAGSRWRSELVARCGGVGGPLVSGPRLMAKG